MKTEDLIRTLATDQDGPVRPLFVALVLGLLPGLAIALLIYGLFLGPRPNLMVVLPEPRLVFKLVFPWAVAACALPTVVRLVQPGADLRRNSFLLLMLVVVLAAAVGIELAVVPESAWKSVWIGHNARFCMIAVPIMSLGPLAAALIALKRGAPTRPALAGACAGLLAAAFGMALYATHCPDDSPLFVACWYGLATLVVVAIGAAAGSRLLRW